MIISLNNYFLSNLKNSNTSKKGNKKLVKAYHLHSFNANSNKYDHLTVSDEGVLHGELESTTGNTVENVINDDEDVDIDTYIALMKRWVDQYGRRRVSSYEVLIGRSLRFLLPQSKGYKVLAQMPIGKRPDADPRGSQMIADLIIEKPARARSIGCSWISWEDMTRRADPYTTLSTIRTIYSRESITMTNLVLTIMCV